MAVYFELGSLQRILTMAWFWSGFGNLFTQDCVIVMLCCSPSVCLLSDVLSAKFTSSDESILLAADSAWKQNWVDCQGPICKETCTTASNLKIILIHPPHIAWDYSGKLKLETKKMCIYDNIFTVCCMLDCTVYSILHQSREAQAFLSPATTTILINHRQYFSVLFLV